MKSLLISFLMFFSLNAFSAMPADYEKPQNNPERAFIPTKSVESGPEADFSFGRELSDLLPLLLEFFSKEENHGNIGHINK